MVSKEDFIKKLALGLARDGIQQISPEVIQVFNHMLTLDKFECRNVSVYKYKEFQAAVASMR